MATMQVQSLIFAKDEFSRAEAVRWAKDHDFSASGVDETDESYRLRQEEPSKFKTMRTINLTEGVKAVVGKSHPPIEKALSPEVVAKALYPGVDPVKLRAQILDDNDGFIGGTIRYNVGSSGGSEFGSEYTDEGVRRNVDGPSERFSFGDLTFDVDAAKELCDGQPNDEIEVSDLWSIKINVDKVAAMRSTSTNPVLVAQIPTSKGLIPLLIDGHHRMYRAHQEGIEKLPAYVLSPEETLFIVDTHPDMATTLGKNLRDILDRPTVKASDTVAEKLAKAFAKLLKAQPGGGDVHVPAAGGEDDEKGGKGGPQENQNQGAEESAGGDVTGAQNEGVGYDQPDLAGKVPKYREKAKKLVKKRLDAIEKAGESGIMVCLYIPREIAEELALPGGEPIEDLHVTLAYIPKLGDDQVAYDAIVKSLRQVAEQFAPVKGSVGGIGIFNPSAGSDGKSVYYASFNSPVLPAFLQGVRSALDWGGISYAMEHGFVPHITLKYLEDREPIRLSLSSEAFRVPAISVASRALGRTDLPLTGSRIMKEDEDDVLAEVQKLLDEDVQVEIPIAKADAKKQIVYGVVLEPDTEDAQGDVMTAEDIEEAAHLYLERARKVKRRHKGDPIEKTFPVESYIAPCDLTFEGGPYGSSVVKKGSWVLGVKVLDPQEWAKIEKGEYKAFSVGGTGVRITL